jgi:hypothetical protein
MSSKTTTMREIEARRKQKVDDAPLENPRKPGEVTPKLRRRMHDPLADIFSLTGVKLYNKSVDSIKASLTELFQQGINDLGGDIKQKLGEYGYEESVDHFRAWMKDVVQDVFGPGMDEVLGALDGMVSSLSVQYEEDETEGGGDMGDLLGTEIPSVPMEDVEEVSFGDEEDEAAGDEAEADEEEDLFSVEEEPKEASVKTAKVHKPSEQALKIFASSKKRFQLRTAASNQLREFDAPSDQ